MRTSRLIAYALPALPLAALGLPLYVHLPAVYAALLAPAVVGAVLFGARIFDVVTDPLIGWLNDRMPARLGRRRLLMLLGLAPLLVGVEWLMRPEDVSALQLLGASVLLYLGWTMVVLPYTAWGAELEDDYHERTRVTLWREGAVVVGTMSAVVGPVLAGADKPEAALAWLASVLLWTIPVCVIVCAVLVPEAPDARPHQPMSLSVGVRWCLRNAAAMRLLLAHLLNSVANALPATLFFFYVESVLGTPDRAGPLLLVYFGAAILALPGWWFLSRRLSKARTWSVSVAWAACMFASVSLLGSGDWFAFAVICLLSGVSLGADMALPASIQADIVEADATEHGQSRAGVFFGLWSMVTKLSLAAAAGIALPLLDVAGFEAGAAVSAPGTTMLVFLYGLAPVALKLPAAWLIHNLPSAAPDAAPKPAPARA